MRSLPRHFGLVALSLCLTLNLMVSPENDLNRQPLPPIQQPPPPHLPANPTSQPDSPSQIAKMKPVVGVMQAWSWYYPFQSSNSKLMIAYCSIVISVFAIVILSVVGALFKSNHHSLMGSTEDPPVNQGPAVAATVFSAVIVYAVRSLPKPYRYSTLPFP
jgi:ribonuclease kappa